MYILQLNDMRSSKSEHLQPVCIAETKEELVALLKRELVPGGWIDTGEHNIAHTTDAAARMNGPFTEHRPAYRWSKNFKKGGPLEWYNRPFDIEGNDDRHFMKTATEAEYVERAREEYQTIIGRIPKASSL